MTLRPYQRVQYQNLMTIYTSVQTPDGETFTVLPGQRNIPCDYKNTKNIDGVLYGLPRSANFNSEVLDVYACEYKYLIGSQDVLKLETPVAMVRYSRVMGDPQKVPDRKYRPVNKQQVICTVMDKPPTGIAAL